MKEFKHFINGEFIPSASGTTFENRSPVDNSLIGMVHEAGKQEVDAAVAAAKQALTGEWGKYTQAQRIALLNKVADRINERFDEFLVAECLDTGKPKKMASHIDIPRGAANFKAFSETLANHPTESFRLDTPDGTGAINIGQRTPKGVIAVISPWNLPLLLMTWKVGPALACGNTVVVKPSEETPATTTLLGEVMNECGVPAGVFNVVHGFGPDSAGAFLTAHKDVDAITFTGGMRRQKPGHCFCRLRFGKSGGRHHALGLCQLWPGVLGYGARLRRTPAIRCLSRPYERRSRQAQIRGARR